MKWGDGEAVMVLQGSWVRNEVTEATESDDSWGFFSMACSKGKQTAQKVLWWEHRDLESQRIRR